MAVIILHSHVIFFHEILSDNRRFKSQITNLLTDSTGLCRYLHIMREMLSLYPKGLGNNLRTIISCINGPILGPPWK